MSREPREGEYYIVKHKGRLTLGCYHGGWWAGCETGVGLWGEQVTPVQRLSLDIRYGCELRAESKDQ